MRRVFLDTNILLDFALEREHADEAEKILALGLAGAEFCKLPFMTAAQFLYEWDR